MQGCDRSGAVAYLPLTVELVEDLMPYLQLLCRGESASVPLDPALQHLLLPVQRCLVRAPFQATLVQSGLLGLGAG